MKTKIQNLAMARFAVAKQEECLYLKGALTGGIDFRKYGDLFKNCYAVNFREVTFASWHGIQNLINFLVKNKINGIMFDDIPSFLSEQVSLAASQFKNLRVGNFSLQTYSVSHKQFSSSVIDFADAKAKILSGQDFEKSGDFSRILNCTELLMENFSSFEEKYGPLDVRNFPKDEVSFWFLYSCFLMTNLNLCVNQLESLAVTCVGSMSELAKRLGSASKALDLLSISTLWKNKPNLLNVEETLSKNFESTLSVLDAARAQVSPLLIKFQMLARRVSTGKPDKLSLLKLLSQIQETLKQFTEVADRVGVETFSQCSALSQGENIKEAFVGVVDEKLSSETLGKVADLFFVFDPFASESWRALKSEILRELDLMDTMVMNLIVETQGFDSIRQVIEKRIQELSVWMSFGGYLSLDDERFLEYREKMLDEISRKMVTEQERFSFLTYFGHIRRNKNSQLESFEVNFF
jgi:hypothetical protein